MKRRGVTLIELLTVLVIAGLIAFAASNAFAIVAKYQIQAPVSRATEAAQTAFESRLTNLFRQAFVDSDATNTSTYFVGRADQESDTTLNSSQNATEVIFTLLKGKASGAAMSAATDSTFEQRNTDIGPAGGVVEIRLGTTALGDSVARQGLFIRQQIPADSDPEQGGFESVLDDRVSSISFEFWDGSEWLPTWTTQQGDRRVPGAVRVTYTLTSTPDVSRRMVCRIASSDVTTANPDQSQQSSGVLQ